MLISHFGMLYCIAQPDLRQKGVEIN